ncbi:FecR family protein [Paraflavitalea soli]|nr:FecR domain-containing protein [Paraflavitalea soli]
MQAGNTKLEDLYIKWFNRTATPQERAALIQLLEAGATKEQLAPIIEKIWDQLKDDDEPFTLSDKQQLADKILKQWPAEPVVTGNTPVRTFRWGWAAAAILLLGASVLVGKLLIEKKPEQQKTYSVVVKNIDPIPPGHDGAVLTLADGQQIVLDSAANGVIGQQQGAQISLHNNQVIYQPRVDQAAGQPKEMTYNTMSTPKGRQFQLVLPDGSKVWLNAASSITYPIAFNKQERRVKITGEVYVEVAHDKTWPFIVQTKNQQIQALGTAFNVNAYENEEIEKTTLIEGSVKVNSTIVPQAVNSHPLSAILLPGQQANIDNSKQLLSIANNQSEAAIAWKNGYFNLENIAFDKVMKQLERWYNIEVVYQSGVPDLRFVGGLSRNMTLDALIRALRVSEVHFKMEGDRRLIVYK